MNNPANSLSQQSSMKLPPKLSSQMKPLSYAPLLVLSVKS